MCSPGVRSAQYSAIDRADRADRPLGSEFSHLLGGPYRSAVAGERGVIRSGFCTVSLRPGRPRMARYAHSAANGFWSELSDGAGLCAALIMSIRARNAAGTCR
jgi:hypothetical protein